MRIARSGLVLGAAAAALALGAAADAPAAPRIAYDSYDGLHTVGPDGSDDSRITDAVGAEPSWPPNHHRIVFSAYVEPGVSRLYTMHADGSHVHAIPDTRQGQAPAWAPGGKRIAFSVWNGSNDAPQGAIFTIRVDGTHRRQLTPFGRYGDPSWSPRGRSILFTIGTEPSIGRMRDDGSHRRAIVRRGYDPSWSPDGRRIAFVGAGVGAESDIYTVRIDGTHRRNVTRSRPVHLCDDFAAADYGYEPGW
jgi:Tol biopolymer transport system component